MEQFDSADGFEMNIQSHICHHLSRQILENFPLVKALLSVPSKLTPSLHSLHSLRRHLGRTI